MSDKPAKQLIKRQNVVFSSFLSVVEIICDFFQRVVPVNQCYYRAKYDYVGILALVMERNIILQFNTLLGTISLPWFETPSVVFVSSTNYNERGIPRVTLTIIFTYIR